MSLSLNNEYYNAGDQIAMTSDNILTKAAMVADYERPNMGDLFKSGERFPYPCP